MFVKGFALSCERLPSCPLLPLRRSCSREIRKESSWADPVLFEDVSAGSLRGDFCINTVSEISVKTPWHFCNPEDLGYTSRGGCVNIFFSVLKKTGYFKGCATKRLRLYGWEMLL